MQQEITKTVKGRPIGSPNKRTAYLAEYADKLRWIVRLNMPALKEAFPRLIEVDPAAAWRIAISLAPKDVQVQLGNGELPAISRSLDALRDAIRGKTALDNNDIIDVTGAVDVPEGVKDGNN